MYHDAYNQLITVDDFWNSATQYRYNASGSRYMRRTGTQAAVYTLRDGSVSVGEYSGSVSTTNWNILLPSGEIVGRQPFSNNPVYYLKDHLGSTRATISSTGAVLESVDYYPFGLEMPGRVTLSGQPTLQRFTGYERVDGERFDYAQARWYDPVIGRFLSVDPLAESFRAWSSYNYVFNNPLIYTDPDGRHPILIKFAVKEGLKYTARRQAVRVATQRTLEATAATGMIGTGTSSVIESNSGMHETVLDPAAATRYMESPPHVLYQLPGGGDGGKIKKGASVVLAIFFSGARTLGEYVEATAEAHRRKQQEAREQAERAQQEETRKAIEEALKKKQENEQ